MTHAAILTSRERKLKDEADSMGCILGRAERGGTPRKARCEMKKWRTAKLCSECPFASKGFGAHLRRTLRPGRWQEILAMLRSDGHFMCHKTTEETGDGSNLLCAGALEWQHKRNLPCQLERIMERIDYLFGKGKAASVKESFAQIARRSGRRSVGEFHEKLDSP